MSNFEFEIDNFIKKVSDVLSCSYRVTIKYFKALPARIKNFLNMKINEIKQRPKRTKMNKKYVLVGYVSREYVDNSFKEERILMLIKTALFVLILVELIFIGIRVIYNAMGANNIGNILGNVESTTITSVVSTSTSEVIQESESDNMQVSDVSIENDENIADENTN